MVSLEDGRARSLDEFESRSVRKGGRVWKIKEVGVVVEEFKVLEKDQLILVMTSFKIWMLMWYIQNKEIVILRMMTHIV